ncbi:MAG: DNA-binding transcriptional LysR family regulator, partial [Oceanospirillaceae bacterium]
GFSAAEVELNVSRSAISASMSDLESRLGLKLCKRGRSGFSLTDSGKNVYENTLVLLDSMEAFRRQINTIHSSLKGELNIGITDNLITMCHTKIVKSLQCLKKESPDVTINITMLPPNEIEKCVLNGQLHIGMVPKVRDCPGLDYLPMYEEHSSLYCGEDHPLFAVPADKLTAEQVLEHDTIALTYALPEYIQKIYDKHNITATVSDREGIAFLLMTGCFIGFLPTHYADSWVERGLFRQIPMTEFSYSTQIMAITKNGNNTDLILNSYMLALQNTK